MGVGVEAGAHGLALNHLGPSRSRGDKGRGAVCGDRAHFGGGGGWWGR